MTTELKLVSTPAIACGEVPSAAPNASDRPHAPAVIAPAAAPPSLGRRLRHGAAWVIGSRMLGIGVTMLVNVALARWLSPEDFGSFLLLTSVLSLASQLAMFGLNTGLVRFVSARVGRGDTAGGRQAMRLVFVVAALTISGTACVAALGMGSFGAKLLALDSVPLIVPMIVVGLVLLSLLQLIAEACRSLHEFRLASFFSGGQTGGLFSNLLFLTMIAAAVVVGKPALSTALVLNLVAMGISLPLAAAGLSRAVRDRLAPLRREHSAPALSATTLVAFCVPVLLIQLLTCVTTQADFWIAGIWWPHDELALYGAARRLMLLVTMPLQMLNLTVVSSIAELYSQQRTDDLERMLRGAASLAAWPSLAVIVVLMFAGGPILEVLFGSYFVQAATPLAILGVGQLFLVCSGSSGCALEMTGHQIGSLAVNLLTALALVTLGAWAAIEFGILGLAITSTAIIIVQSLSLWLLARKLVGVWTHPALWPDFSF